MDPALVLLWKLRLKAFFRRWGRTLRKPRGILLTLIGLLVFVPWIFSVAMTPRELVAWDPAKVRRFGPLILLAWAMLTLALSSGERVLFFTPSEIDFLFPGPFTRRGLLAYKVAGAVFGVLFSAIFLLLGFLKSTRSPVSAYLAIVLAMLFFQFLGMAVGLASNTVAAFATGVRRRAVVVAVIVLFVAAVWSAGAELFHLPFPEALARLENSPVVRAATLPFRPFIGVLAAGWGSPEMLGWAAASLGMVVAMGAVVFAIDAQYLETSAASSARLYAQLQRMRQGGGLMPGRGVGATRARRARSRLTMLPWWGGVGPVLWRQLASALREPLRLTILSLVLTLPGLGGLLGRSAPGEVGAGRIAAVAMLGMGLYFATILSTMVAFDFRGDVDRMVELKSLPIHPIPLVVGQLMTPVLISTVPSWLVFTLASPAYGRVAASDFLLLAFLAPSAALMIGIDNLLFLVFPTRTTQATAADFSSMGRQVILILAKVLLGGFTALLAVLVGSLVLYLSGGAWTAAYLAALVVPTLAAAGLVPLLALAFVRYDVAGDTPA